MLKLQKHKLTGGVRVDTLVELELLRLLGVSLQPGDQIVPVRIYAVLRKILALHLCRGKMIDVIPPLEILA